jgi:hypothetical protein
MKAGIASLALLAVAGTLLAQSRATPSPALLVLSKGDHTLAIVDPATLQVVARMPSGPDPHEVTASADGKLAYISNYGSGAYNTITVVDLVAQKTLRAIDLGVLHGPHGLDYVDGKLYFTAEANKVFGRYDPATSQVDWIMGTGQDRTHMITVWKDLSRIVTTNVSSATLSIFEKSAAGPAPGGPSPQSAADRKASMSRLVAPRFGSPTRATALSRWSMPLPGRSSPRSKPTCAEPTG